MNSESGGWCWTKHSMHNESTGSWLTFSTPAITAIISGIGGSGKNDGG